MFVQLRIIQIEKLKKMNLKNCKQFIFVLYYILFYFKECWVESATISASVENKAASTGSGTSIVNSGRTEGGRAGRK